MSFRLSLSVFAATAIATLINSIAPVHAFTIQPLAEDTTGFKEVIHEYQQFVQAERLAINNPEARQLDPTKLFLGANHDVRVFFLNEGAGKRNTLNFSATGASTASGSVFENIACITGCQISESNGNLNIGDWVSLGNFQAGTLFDFALRAINYHDRQADVYGANPSSNPDGLSHLVAYEYKNRVILGFEDLLGGLGATGGRNEQSDRDFNDMAFVIDMPVNAEATPEPTTMAGLALAGGLALIKRRQQRTAKAQKA